jgi:hypothetical protein
MLHCNLLVGGLIAGEGSTVRGRFDAVFGRQEGSFTWRRARRYVRGTSDECRQVGLRDDVLSGSAFLMVAVRGNEHARVDGQMCHKFAVENRVGPEAAGAVGVSQRWSRCRGRGVAAEVFVGHRVEI